MWWFIFFFALLIPLAAVILDSQLGRALAGVVERWSRGSEISGAGDAHRLGMLEAEVERLGREVERLREQSDFLQRLLDERPTPSRALESGNRDE